MNCMNVQCTIEVDGETFSVSTSGKADEESTVARAVAGSLAAIACVNGNLTMGFLLAEILKAANDCPRILKAAAQAWCTHDIEPKDTHNWKLLIDKDAWEEPRDRLHLPQMADFDAANLLDEYDQIVAALPKTRDGVPVWAGKTVYTIAGKPEIFTWASIHNVKDCYSTPEAARAAKR